MKAKKETKSPTPSNGLGGTLVSEADEDEDLEDEEADLDEEDFKEVSTVLSNQLINKQTTSAHLEHKHNNFSPLHILS
jgi:hypothetical protein